MEYDKPHPQSQRRCDKEALVVGGLAADNQQPPPLPPKPDKSQPLQESSVPPQLPPKPNSNPPPLPPRDRNSFLHQSAGAGNDATSLPPLPPKPRQFTKAKPAEPQRRIRRSPSPSFQGAQATAQDEATAPAKSCKDCNRLTEEKHELMKENDSLVQKNERMKGVHLQEHCWR